MLTEPIRNGGCRSLAAVPERLSIYSKARQKIGPMSKERQAAVRTSAGDAISTARTAVAHARQILAEAREQVQETKALVRRIHSERERAAGEK